MHPGALISDVGHFKEVFVDPRIDGRLLKERLMGAGAAGGYHHPVKVVFLDQVFNIFLVVL